MGVEALRNAQKNEVLESIKDFLAEHYGDAIRTGTSEIAMPAVDANGEEIWLVVKISVPRGTRNGEGGYDPYDGYAAAEEYKEEEEAKKAKKAKAQEEKAAKERERARKKEAKKVVQDLNKKGLNGMIHG